MITFDHSKLRGRITEKFGTQSAFAREMGISEATLSMKLAGKNYFTSDEIVQACDLLDIDLGLVADYFFDFKV